MKVCIVTQGCPHNVADSEQMAGALKKEHELSSFEDADLIVFNTCTVKTPSENTFKRNLKKAKGKKVVIAGCIPQIKVVENYSCIGVDQTDKILDAVNETVKGNVVKYTKRKNKIVFNNTKVRRNKYIEIVPISTGCTGACTFCATKFARGNLRSQSVKDIVTCIRNALNEGVKEVWLTSEDTACYGFDIGTNVARLIKEICRIEKDFRLRIGMGNPDGFMKIKGELLEAMKSDKVYRFLHVPLQCASNRVLKLMNRKYTVEDYKELIKGFECTLATDIITGFPGESENDFNETLKVVQDIKFDVINISRFWPREGTVANKMKQLAPGIAKFRSRVLTELFEKISLENNKSLIKSSQKVTVLETGKNGTLIGRTQGYKPVVMKNVSLGDKLTVQIKSATKWDLRA